MEQKDLNEAREAIAQIDKDMAALFVKRMRAAETIAAYKNEHSLPVYDAAQEARVIERNTAYIEDETIRAHYLGFMQNIMDISKAYQERLNCGARIAYNGVEGAFAQIAASKIFPNGNAISHSGFESAYNAVVSGDCDCAVLPIENSDRGEINQVIDLMLNGPLYVNAIKSLRISQNLLGIPGTTRDRIAKVISHPQALGQCEAYLAKRGVEIVEATSTAAAAQMVAQAKDPTVAAIASVETALIYGLDIIDEDINGSSDNTTRFAVFSRVANHEAASAENTFILLFTVKHEAGALAKAINVISEHGFNMKALRSHPMKGSAWHYYFYVEAEGDEDSDEAREMLAELSKHCDMLKVAGHYCEEA